MLKQLPTILFFFFFVQSSHAAWEYQKLASSTTGNLTTTVRNQHIYVSLKQFCYALSCQVFYQWPQFRAIVKNPKNKSSAILSSLTYTAIIDGHVYELKSKIISDIKEGYLVPIELVQSLASDLALGKIFYTETLIASVSKTEKKKIQKLETIIIDPGHGGNDFGTEVKGVFEKDISLTYAIFLKEKLATEYPKLKVFLTRDSDRYVSLPDRAMQANSLNAQLFISLHVNHAADKKVEGVETYILNPQATDDEARKVALLENSSWLKNLQVKNTGDEIVDKILVDMEQTRHIQDSAMFAALAQKEFKSLEEKYGLKNRGVKQAMFYVLAQVAMPSALVEIGFLSNTGDRSRMFDISFKDNFLKSLVHAIKQYEKKFENKP